MAANGGGADSGTETIHVTSGTQSISTSGGTVYVVSHSQSMQSQSVIQPTQSVIQSVQVSIQISLDYSQLSYICIMYIVTFLNLPFVIEMQINNLFFFENI